MMLRNDENTLRTDSQDYGADEILYIARTALFNKTNQLIREIMILFMVYPPVVPAELWVKNGCLNFWVTRLGNFNIRQRLKSFDAHKYRKFHVRMKIIPSGGDRAESRETSTMRLKWGNQDKPIIGSKCSIDEKSNIEIASVKVDGEFHEYELNLSANLH